MEFWGGKNRSKKTVFSRNIRPNFRFFTKIPKIRQSHYQPEWCANFQGNPNLASKNVKMTFFGRLKSHFEYAAAPRAICHIARPCMLCVRNAYAVAAGSARPVWPGGVHFARTGTTNSTTQNKWYQIHQKLRFYQGEGGEVSCFSSLSKVVI